MDVAEKREQDVGEEKRRKESLAGTENRVAVDVAVKMNGGTEKLIAGTSESRRRCRREEGMEGHRRGREQGQGEEEY